MEAIDDTVTVQTYPAYKDSDVDWLGEIPAHWQMRKLKYIFQEKKHTPNQLLNCGSISFGKVVVKDDEKIPDSTRASYQEVLSGEFLINPLNLNYDLISLRIALSYIEVVVSPGYIVIKNIVDLNREYFKFLLHRYDVAYMKLLGSGVRQTISFNHIANSLLILPPLEEQTRIADFLDRKTAQIDQAIAQKERLIDLLNERRQVLIHRAVTRGLDPNVPLKDSGIDWLGEIPAHWDTRKLRFLCEITTGGKDTENKEDDGLYPFFVRSQTVERISSYSYDTEGILTAGDGVGVCKVWHHIEGKFDFHQRVYLMHNFKNVVGKFLFYFLRMNFECEVLKLSAKSTVDSLRRPMFQNFQVAFPSKEEQNNIVNHLENKLEEIDKIIIRTENQIQKLQELKATLINSAVTGKIKV